MRKGASVQPILGKAGTVVLFDITSVHRGLTVERGRQPRMVLTNYYENFFPGCKSDKTSHHREGTRRRRDVSDHTSDSPV